MSCDDCATFTHLPVPVLRYLLVLSFEGLAYLDARFFAASPRFEIGSRGTARFFSAPSVFYLCERTGMRQPFSYRQPWKLLCH